MAMKRWTKPVIITAAIAIIALLLLGGNYRMRSYSKASVNTKAARLYLPKGGEYSGISELSATTQNTMGVEDDEVELDEHGQPKALAQGKPFYINNYKSPIFHPTNTNLKDKSETEDIGIKRTKNEFKNEFKATSVDLNQVELPTFYPSKDLFVRAVYFDGRSRNGHANATVFLVVMKRNISDNKLIVGCQVGDLVSTNFKLRLIGETPLWRAFYDHINHEEVMVDCYDLPVENGSRAYIMFKTSANSGVQVAASERPLVFPAPRIPPTSPEGLLYNLTIITCAKVFYSPPWMKEWLEYQRTLGVDHVHLDAEDTFVSAGWLNKPYIKEAMDRGFLTIDVWKKYLSPSELWYHNQGLIYEDCSYRFRGTYDYIFLLDTDDFFTPRVVNQTKLHFYINSHCRRKTIGSCKFKWVEYFPDYYSLNKNKSIADGNITRQLSNYSHYNQGNPKSIHRTSVLIDTATHYAYQMMKGYYIENVPVCVAYVAHVRKGKKPPNRGLVVGLPSSYYEHVLSKLLLVIILFLCFDIVHILARL